MITSVWTTPGECNETALAIERAVFPEAVFPDAFEPFSFQLALLNEGTPVAAGRFYLRSTGKAQLDRICVLPPYRCQGIGDGLIRILDFKAATVGLQESYAEVPLEYEKLFARIGFAPFGEPFEKNGRRLQNMKKECNDGSKGHCSHQ